MGSKISWLGILALALVFGITVIGCDNGSDGGGGPKNNILNGTWLSGYGAEREELRLGNDTFELTAIEEGVRYPLLKGNYFTSGIDFTMSPTHLHGSLLGLNSQWFTISELKTLFHNLGMEGMLDEELDEVFSSETGPYFLSNNDNTLTITLWGDRMVYNRIY